MEEGRQWKIGGEGGIRRGIEWLRGGIFLAEYFGERIFTKEGSKEGAGMEG